MKRVIVLLSMFIFLRASYLFAGEFDFSVFVKHQLSTDAVGLRLGIGGNYQFNAIGDLFAPGFSIETSVHPLSILSKTTIGSLGASVFGSFLLNGFAIKPLFGFNWTYASGLINIEDPEADLFQLIVGLELMFKFIGIEYCYFLPEPSLAINRNKEFIKGLGDHRFGVIYHHKF